MQHSRHRVGTLPLLAKGLPMSLQRSPDGLPVLRRRFHHDFLNLLLDQILRQQSQLCRVAPKLAPTKLVLTIDFDVRDSDRQHPLMDVNSCYLVRHRCSFWRGAESVPSVTLSRVTGYATPIKRDTTPNYSLNTHAPDQTPLRLPLLHSLLDLAAPGRYAS